MLKSWSEKNRGELDMIFLVKNTNMKKTILSTLLILAVAGLVRAQTDQWVDYSSEGGKFSVLLPDQPTPSTLNSEIQPQDAKTGKPVGKKVRFTYNDVTSKNGQSFYLVGWVDYQPGFNFDPKGELRANRDNFINQSGATLISQKPIKLGVSEGIEFIAEKSPNAYIKGRVYVIGKRPYILVAVTFDKEDTGVDKFFDSFKLNKK